MAKRGLMFMHEQMFAARSRIEKGEARLTKVSEPKAMLGLRAAVLAMTDALFEAKGRAMTPEVELTLSQFQQLYVATGELPIEFVEILRGAIEPVESNHDVQSTFQRAREFVYTADKLLVEAELSWNAQGLGLGKSIDSRYDFTPPPQPSSNSRLLDGAMSLAALMRQIDDEWKVS